MDEKNLPAKPAAAPIGPSPGSIPIEVGVNSGAIVVGDHSVVGLVVTPEGVAMLVSMVSATVGVTTAAIKGIQLWIDERKSRKIRIRYKEAELELSGPISEAEIAARLSAFTAFQERMDGKEVKIVVVDDEA